LQGVQIVASYTVVVGVVNFLALFTGRPWTSSGESAAAAFIDSVQTLIHALALVAGLKGLVGVMLRDPQRLRVLYLYHAGELVVSCFAILFREIEACKELSKLQRAHRVPWVDCPSARLAHLFLFTIHFCLFSYFADIGWSLVKRLEAGELGRPPLLGDHELVDQTGLLDLFAPWPGMQHGSLQHPPGSGVETGSSLLGAHRGPQANATGSAPPFSGQPRTLAEQGQPQQGLQPFTGQAHRLE
jgi:hypothetical protein